MKEKVIGIMSMVFTPEKVDEYTTQSNCEKWDSLHHLNLIVELEDAFNMEFEPEEIAEMKSVDAVCRVIESKQA